MILALVIGPGGIDIDKCFKFKIATPTGEKYFPSAWPSSADDAMKNTAADLERALESGNVLALKKG